MEETHDSESTTSPTEILKRATPPDDAGAATYDRYEWQAVMATADVLAEYLRCLDETGTLRDGAWFEVICEHHEDWALSDGYTAEIVSAKHKETSVGPLSSIRSLLLDGGVLHLFDRWLSLRRTPYCRLVTTAGLTADARSVLNVAQAFANGASDGSEHDAIMTKLIQAVADARRRKTTDEGTETRGTTSAGAHGAAGDRPTLAAFLGMLRIQHSQPSRDHVAFLAPSAYARPIAEQLSIPTAANAIWIAVLGLVRERMRAAGPRRTGGLPIVLGARDESGYEARTVTLSDVAVAVRVAIEHQSGFRPLPRRIRTSTLAMKMAIGGCSDNAVERAEELRRQYRQYWRDVQAAPSVDPARQRVENRLLRVIDEATTVVRINGQEWGSALWQELQARLDAAAATGQSHGLDTDLLLGGVSELSNQCRAWFSDAFDVQAAVAHLLSQQVGEAVVPMAAVSGDGHNLERAGDLTGDAS